MFPTQYTKKDRVISNSGERFNPTYKLKIDKEGRIDLIQDGKIDVYERIQSYREECDIKCILQRFLAGDEAALNKYAPLFGDFTEAPNSLAEYYQKIMDAEAIYNKLPVDVKAQFNNSSSEFFASVGSEKFNSIFGIKPAAAQQEEQQPPAVDEKGDAE